ncbi:unnamed protein product [Clavelina lepadiformis]|uniref:Uncharacterized protein n=1 Tax=Clavelina lepadiformis TaxID=159417 RepID=A0ABP0G2H0_CLALP
MTKQLSEAERKKKYTYYTTMSPLMATNLQRKSVGKEFATTKQIKKKQFILDGVHENVHKSNVVPSYNAFNDPHAQSYFRQPAVQDMLKRSAVIQKGNLLPPASLPSYKLSFRRRAPGTPAKLDLIKRENRFVVDCIRSDARKTSHKPVIPKYDALNDIHAQNYFRKKSVRLLLRETCQLKL